MRMKAGAWGTYGALSVGPLKGLQLGYGSPSTSIQGHMIPDSDGEVKLMKAFIIYKVFPYPYSLLPL